MVLIATNLRGSLSFCLLSHCHGASSFNFYYQRRRPGSKYATSFSSVFLTTALLPKSSGNFSVESNPPHETSVGKGNLAVRPNYQTFQWLLEGCFNSNFDSLRDVQRLHSLILKSGFHLEYEVGSRLVEYYIANGCLGDADEVFDDLVLSGSSIPLPLWNDIIAGFAAKKGSPGALSLFSRMISEADVFPNGATFAYILEACGEDGRKKVGLGCIEQIHGMIIRFGYGSSSSVCNMLIKLYAKNGLIDSSQLVYENICLRDSTTWVAMISGLLHNGREEQAVLLFCNEMHAYGVMPTPYVLSSTLSACRKIELFELGRELQALTFKWGFAGETFVTNALVSLYCQWGDFTSAEKIFRKMQYKDAVSYNSIISGLAKCKFSKRAFEIFKKMQEDCLKPDCVTIASLLSACASIGALCKGVQLHSYALKSGYCSDMITEGALLDLYFKCCDVGTAHKFFATTGMKNIVLWNVMLKAYGQMGNLIGSCEIFSQLMTEGLEPGQYTYPSILRTCTDVGALGLGEQIHTLAVKTGFQFDVHVCSVLIDMYAKHGYLCSAQKIFNRLQEDDLVSWTAMIAGYTKQDFHVEALELFEKMINQGIQPDSICFSSAISACSGIQALEQGRQIHAQTYVFGYSEYLSVCNALLSLYARCRKVQDADLVFQKIDAKDSISWNVLISGFAQSGEYEESLKVFALMNKDGIETSIPTYVSAISAAANIANIKQGKQIHAKLLKAGYNLETEASNTLISLYAKCGSIDDARKEFSGMVERNEVTWNALITGYSQHGRGKEALELFEEMIRLGLMPNHVTFIGVLSACSHVGLVDEGLSHFESMSREYGLVPKLKHYVCVVDILGRAGFLSRAKMFIEDMPIEPDANVWRSLLSACILHKNVEIGEFASEHLVELEPEDSATYVLLSNLYAVNKKWSSRDKTRQMMKDRGVKKEPGQSWIEVKSSIHAFFAGDRLHPWSNRIYEYLEDLNKRATELGYSESRDGLLHELEKDPVLHVHSERLAIAFGLLSLSSSIPLLVMKNLRVCNDCHNWIKCVSKISNRAIVVRDAYRFHHFEDGSCSCKDYW